jgi:hypothetical protein
MNNYAYAFENIVILIADLQTNERENFKKWDSHHTQERLIYFGQKFPYKLVCWKLHTTHI